MRWQCDHITPLADGGTNDELNLQAICANCHSEKSILEAQARARMRREAQLQAQLQARREEAARRADQHGDGTLDLKQYLYVDLP